MAGGGLTLAFDAAGDRCAVGLFDGECPLAERAEPMRRGHAERLFPLIDTVLCEAGRRREDVGRVVVATGPGSFAGARIAVAAARGLALALGVPAVGVTWLEALGATSAGPALVRLPYGSGLAIQRFEGGVAVSAPSLVAPDDPAAAARPGEAALGEADLAAGGLRRLVAAAGPAAARAARPEPLYLRPPDATPAPPGPSLRP